MLCIGRPEDSRVKIPALVHFTRLGYTYMSIKGKGRGIDYDPDTNIFCSLFRKYVNEISGIELAMEEIKKMTTEIKMKLANEDFGMSFFEFLNKGYEGIKFIDYTENGRNSYVVVTKHPYENGDDKLRSSVNRIKVGKELSLL